MLISEAVSDFNDLANAVISDDLDAAIRSINFACEAIDRAGLSLGNQSITTTIPASSSLIPFSTLSSTYLITQVKNVFSDELVVRLVDYTAFIELQRQYESRQAGQGISSTTMSIVAPSELYATCLGSNLLLYPNTKAEVSLRLNARVKLEYFQSGAENYATASGYTTNYLLTYYPSLVIARALVEYAVYRRYFSLYDGYMKSYQEKLNEVLAEEQARTPDIADKA